MAAAEAVLVAVVVFGGVGLRDVAFAAVVFLAIVFFAGAFFALFLGADFFALAFLALAFFAVTFFELAFLAEFLVDRLAVLGAERVLFRADVLLAVLLEEAFLAARFRAVDFLAVFREAVLPAPVFFAVVRFELFLTGFRAGLMAAGR
jgi:hypothetical protein